MPYYRLRFGKGGRAGCFDEFQAADDGAALRAAERHLPSGEGELWCGERQVATIGAAMRGIAPPDPVMAAAPLR